MDRRAGSPWERFVVPCPAAVLHQPAEDLLDHPPLGQRLEPLSPWSLHHLDVDVLAGLGDVLPRLSRSARPPRPRWAQQDAPGRGTRGKGDGLSTRGHRPVAVGQSSREALLPRPKDGFLSHTQSVKRRPETRKAQQRIHGCDFTGVGIHRCPVSQSFTWVPRWVVWSQAVGGRHRPRGYRRDQLRVRTREGIRRDTGY
jgi:hypothetical protein